MVNIRRTHKFVTSFLVGSGLSSFVNEHFLYFFFIFITLYIYICHFIEYKGESKLPHFVFDTMKERTTRNSYLCPCKSESKYSEFWVFFFHYFEDAFFSWIPEILFCAIFMCRLWILICLTFPDVMVVSSKVQPMYVLKSYFVFPLNPCISVLVTLHLPLVLLMFYLHHLSG